MSPIVAFHPHGLRPELYFAKFGKIGPAMANFCQASQNSTFNTAKLEQKDLKRMNRSNAWLSWNSLCLFETAFIVVATCAFSSEGQISAESISYQVVERGVNHRIVQGVASITNSFGEPLWITNSYTSRRSATLLL